jgi:hypothetical protein
MEGFIKYAVEMGSGAMICIPSFIKIGSGIHKLMGADIRTHRQHGDLISLFLFFQNKESRLNIQLRSELSPFIYGTITIHKLQIHN